MSTIVLRSGDLRPWVADFLKHHYSKSVQVHSSPPLTLTCLKNDKGALERIPDFTELGPVLESVKQFPDQVHITGVRVMSKVCKNKPGMPTTPDRHAHWFPIILNPVTRKALLYNPLMFQLDSPNNFSFGVVSTNFMKQLKTKFAEGGINLDAATAVKAHKTLVRRVHQWANTKMGKNVSARLWFPLLVIAEMSLCIENPAKQRAEIVSTLKQMDDIAFDKLFSKMHDQLESYYISRVYNKRTLKGKQTQSDHDSCAKDKLLHPETSHCVAKKGKLGLKLQGITPSKICDDNQSYNISTRRCRKLSYKFSDIHMDVSADSNEKTFLDDAIATVALSDYIVAKYPHAAVFSVKGANNIDWQFNDKTKEGVLFIPRAFGEFWKKALKDSRKTQIVVFVTLMSSAHDAAHANVIVLTKQTNELEVFEPNGLVISKSFGAEQMYREIESYFKPHIPDVKLRTPIDYCPKKTSFFQALETDERGLWKTDGYCAVWTVWYTEHRLMNPDLTTKDCVSVALKHLLDMGSLREFIWNYDRWMRRQLDANSKKKKI